MAKKTEQELRSILKGREEKRDYLKGVFGDIKKRVVTFDKAADGKDVGKVTVFSKDKEIIDELANYASHCENPDKKNISKKSFKAYFENEDFPQDDEILAVKFRPSEDGDDKLYVDITFAPKRKLYFNLLTEEICDEPFIIEVNNKDGEKVDEVKIYLTTASFALSTPVEFAHNRTFAQSLLNDDVLTYELEFDFAVE